MESLVVFISLIALVVACWQWAIADQRIRIELFQNRIRIYRAVQEAIHEAALQGNPIAEADGPSYKVSQDLLLAVAEARWMFNEQIYEFLDKCILDDFLTLKATLSLIHEHAPSQQIRENLVRAEELRVKLRRHSKELPGVCGPLLSIERWSLPEVIISLRDSVYTFWRRWFQLDGS